MMRIWPWSEIADLKDAIAIRRRSQFALHNEKIQLIGEVCDLRAQLAKFDHDGDGKAGGSKRKTAP
jgi:hypothetical protein